MAIVPKLDRLTRMDTGPNPDPIRQMAIWQEMCEKIEEAFGEVVDLIAFAATKNSIFVADTAPTPNGINDLWFDSNDGYKPYSADGLTSGDWVEVQDVGAAYARLGVNPDGTIANDKVINASVLAGEVLTTPGGAVTSSTTLSSGSYTWTTCATWSVDASGVEMTVRVDFDTEIIDNCKIMYRVQCDAATLGRERGPISVNTADEPGYSITRKHTPAAGTRSYTLQCAVNDAGDAIIHDPVGDFTENRNI